MWPRRRSSPSSPASWPASLSLRSGTSSGRRRPRPIGWEAGYGRRDGGGSEEEEGEAEAAAATDTGEERRGGPGGERRERRPRRPRRRRTQRPVGRRNFECVKIGGFSYTIFPASGCVVVTGISSLDRVEAALSVFRASARLEEAAGERLLPHSIVNSTYSGTVHCGGRREGRSVSVCEAVASVFGLERGGHDAWRRPAEYDPGQRWYVSFRSQFFPGLCLRRRETSGGGTVNLFNNGRYVLVGVRSQKQAEDLTEELCALMKRCWTTLGGVTSCAWPAGS